MTKPSLLRKLRKHEQEWRKETRMRTCPERWFHYACGRAQGFADVIGWLIDTPLPTRPVKKARKVR